MIGIYKITNLINKRIYIGQSSDILKRFKQYHKLQNCKTQTLLYRSLKKYGVENHKFEIITECDVKDLNNLERYYQDLYNVIDPKCGMNLKLTNSKDRNVEHSKETKQKIAEKLKGNKNMLGKKHSEESKKKMSEKSKNMSDDIRLKMSLAAKGRKHSEESKKKMSESKLKMSDETRKKMSDARKGKKASDETRKKLSESKKGIMRTESQIKKQRESLKKRYESGYVNAFAKMVIDLETGFVYSSAKEAWDCNRDYLKTGRAMFNAKLSGSRKNNTKFIYA